MSEPDYDSEKLLATAERLMPHSIQSAADFDHRVRMVASTRQHAFDACAAICREIMEECEAGARKETYLERENIHLHALRWSRYGTAKQILERIAALPSE